jgi:carboxymethylenebutenolidase
VDVAATDVELGFLAHPATGTHPGVVLIPDVWGLSAHARDVAARLAAEGFAVLALNLYRRLAEVKIADPGRFIRALDDREVLGDVQAAADFLAAHAAVGGRRVGVIGFCMGGMYAILAAARCRGLSAAVPFYGMLSDAHGLLAPPPGEPRDPAKKPATPLGVARDLRCPTLAFFGEDDAFIPMQDVRAFEAALAPAHRVVVYPGAGHAFLNDTRPEMYRPDAAADARQQMVAWLHQHLARK